MAARKPARTASLLRAPTPPPAAEDPAALERFIRGAPSDVSGRPAASPGVPAPRAPQGSKVLLTRRNGDVRRRMTVYLTESTADDLEDHCADGNREKSAVVDRAVRAYLARARLEREED